MHPVGDGHILDMITHRRPSHTAALVTEADTIPEAETEGGKA